MTGSAQRVAEEVVKHLTGIVGAKVSVHLEIEAHAATGFPDDVVRTIGENAGTLKLTAADFEEE